MSSPTLDDNAVRDLIRKELPDLVRQDPGFRSFVLDVVSGRYADRARTEQHIDHILEELRLDREENARKFDVLQHEWTQHREENASKFYALQQEWKQYREEGDRKWEENNRKSEARQQEWNQRWEESNRKQDERWAEHQREFDRVHEEIMALTRRQARTLGALGARWGLNMERSFRDALAAILEKSFGVEVLNVVEWDDKGEVFGRPDQVELDVIVRNGTLIICEIKPSIDKAGLYAFERKARFYERLHSRTADRLIVISPMVDPRARPVVDKLGLEVYADSLDVPAAPG